ncbi:MAG: hypothetical protein ACW963_02330 [Candidatus Sifarchaeia archaeon]|jgi:hypothetical protein
MKKLKKGDLIIYESVNSPDRLPGIVTDVTPAGSVTVRWNDGSLNTMGMASIVNDVRHVCFSA